MALEGATCRNGVITLLKAKKTFMFCCGMNENFLRLWSHRKRLMIGIDSE